MNARSQPPVRPTWRQLTDEQRWAKIYHDRQRQAESLPRALPEGRRLVIPVALVLDALMECKAVGVDPRADVLHSLATHIPKMTSLLKAPDRNTLAENVDVAMARVRAVCPNAVAYLYATACAVAHMIAQGDFPEDSPGALGALAIKIELEETGGDVFRKRDGTLEQGLSSVGKVLDVYRAMHMIA